MGERISSLSRPLLLENPVLAYAWGSRVWLAELQGRPAPSAEPEAELWMGAHPKAPSRVRIDGDRVPLPELITARPEAVLGPAVAERFGARLPFLFKVLAVEAALSVQAHPDALQAAEGFEREERAGIPRQAPQRCYPDPGPKPELVCALTRFHALRGFRRPQQIAERLARLGVPELGPPASSEPGPALRAFLERLLRMEPGARRRCVERAARRAHELGAADPDLAWIPRLDAQHPGDAGVLAPVFLERVELEPGEAMFLPARELHCYLEGSAVELMANSDNVLRGGLTEKHVDTDELLGLLRFEPGRFERLRPGPAEQGFRYASPAREFCLARIELGSGDVFESRGERSVEILLCVAGQVRLETRAGGSLRLGRGASALLPVAAGDYRAEGEGLCYRAAVPL